MQLGNKQHQGDLIVDREIEISGQVTGLTRVLAGGVLIAHGQLAGGLIIEAGGKAVVHGQVSRNVVNDGGLKLFGQVSGQVLGNPPENELKPHQIVGVSLPVPHNGKTTSWSSSF